jgi:primosomal protein N' (replication factor Y) (superfamily II helicase)
MNYAEVAVNSPGSRSTFSYAVPGGLSIRAGQAVWVPFGNRIIQGIVVRLSDAASVAGTKDIADIVAASPLLSPLQIKLAQWMSERYLAPLFDALALMLPPGFERRAIAGFRATGLRAELPLTPAQRQVLNTIEKKRAPACPSWRRQLAGPGPGKSPGNCWTLS